MDIFDRLITNVLIRTAEERPVLTIMGILFVIFLIVMYLRMRV